MALNVPTGRARWIAIIAVLGALLTVVLTFTVAGDDDDDATQGTTADGAPATSADESTTTETAPQPVDYGDVQLQVVAVNTDSPFGTTPVDTATSTAITTAVNAYLHQASMTPLADGTEPVGLDQVFTATALARATGVDREIVLDTGLPPATLGLEPGPASVTLTVLVGEGEAPVNAVAELDVTFTSHTDDGPIVVHRTGSLVLVPGPAGWLVDGYELAVERTGPGVPVIGATTTAPAGGVSSTPTSASADGVTTTAPGATEATA